MALKEERVDSTETPKRKKKHRKRSKTDAVVESETPETPKVKKHRKHDRTGAENAGVEPQLHKIVTDSSTPPLKKKKKHRKTTDPESEAEVETPKRKRPRKSSSEDAPAEAMDLEEPKRKSKKNKAEVPKVVKFADEPVASGGDGANEEDSTKSDGKPTRTPKFSNLKTTPSRLPEKEGALPVATAEGGGKQKKVKKSENALRRIKWVKRKRRKLTKRQRKANRELALSRPRREVSEHVADAIAYLNSWYNDQENWKFKKVAQLTLIEHAFNPKLIDEDTFELLLYYLEGMHDGPKGRLRGMCQQLIDNEGKELESPAFPLSLPDDLEGTTVVVKRAKMILDNVTSSSEQS